MLHEKLLAVRNQETGERFSKGGVLACWTRNGNGIIMVSEYLYTANAATIYRICSMFCVCDCELNRY